MSSILMNSQEIAYHKNDKLNNKNTGLSRYISKIYSHIYHRSLEFISGIYKKLNSKSETINTQKIYDSLRDQIQCKADSSLTSEQIEDISSAFMVMFGLAVYKHKVDMGCDRKNFSLAMTKDFFSIDDSRLSAQTNMIYNMPLDMMLKFYKHDNIVIPRTGGILQGVAGIFKKTHGFAATNNFEDYFRKDHNSKKTKRDELVYISNEFDSKQVKYNYVVVFQDRLIGSCGHVAMQLNSNNRCQYISHDIDRRDLKSLLCAVIPGLATKKTNRNYITESGCYGIPDFVIPLKNLNNEHMLQYIYDTKNIKYNLFTYNCSTKVGNIILAGLPKNIREKVHVPKLFWTPYDVTVLAQEVYKIENSKDSS